MSSGFKTLAMNLRERATSADINRLQAFQGKDSAELFRYMLDVTGNDDLDAGAVIVEPGSIETPLRAEIINGLLVRPATGTLALTVDPGVVMLMAPDAAADESNYKYIRDAGIPSAGTLAMTANGAGTPRVDVIECQRNAVDAIVTDTRDIFDPVTGVFTATSVTKERAGRLTYRVRAGTAGSGWPGLASGWLPLAVVSVPAAAATNNAMTFWDVRPLLNDRAYGYSALRLDRPIIEDVTINVVAANNGRGFIRAISAPVTAGQASRRLGGILRSGTDATDTDSINFDAALNRQDGIAFTGDRPWYVYLFTPFGLPRWARYTASGTRLPRSPRGIPLMVTTAPNTKGAPSAAITMPAALGFGATTTLEGVCVAAGYNDPGGARAGFYVNGRVNILCDASLPEANRPMQVTGTLSGGGGASAFSTFDLTAGTHYPTNATEILCEFRTDLGPNGSNDPLRSLLRIYPPNDTASPQTRIAMQNSNTGTQVASPGAVPLGGGETNIFNQMWVPLPTVYPSATAPNQRLEVEYYSPAAHTFTTAGSSGTVMRVLGWKI